jgi:hypothetical protein
LLLNAILRNVELEVLEVGLRHLYLALAEELVLLRASWRFAISKFKGSLLDLNG